MSLVKRVTGEEGVEGGQESVIMCQQMKSGCSNRPSLLVSEIRGCPS